MLKFKNQLNKQNGLWNSINNMNGCHIDP